MASAQDTGAFSPEQVARNARLVALTQNRQAAEVALHQKWAILAEDGGDELADALSRLSYNKLLRAQDAQTVEELNAVITGKALDVDVPNSIGDNNADLVFTPVTPCRIVNTRNISAPLVPGVIRGFDTNLASFVGQGGSATTCGLPGSDTAALAVTVTVVAPTGAGNLRAWPYGGTVPTASVINYAAYAGLNLANTTVIPLTQNVMQDYEFSVRADVSGTDLIVDVVGYYWSPEQTALTETVLSEITTVAAGASFSAYSPTCPADTLATGGGHRAAHFGYPASLAASRPMGTPPNRWLAQGVNGAAEEDYEVYVICSAIPGR